MPLKLTSGQLDQIASNLLICRDPATTKLPKPATTVADPDFVAKLDRIGADPTFGFPAYGVVDLTASVSSPKVWLHKPAELWRIASTAKLAMLLAAVQLRADVRWLFTKGFIKDGKDGDELFATAALWRRAKNPTTVEMAKSQRPPRISTMFDFSGPVPEFIGPQMNLPANRQEVVDNLVAATRSTVAGAHLPWKFVSNFDFTERLWLAGARSDNVAATACISEIGVAYLKAVQVAYGLFDLANDVCVYLAGGYTGVDTSVAVDPLKPKVKYRTIERGNAMNVLDAIHEKGKKGFTDTTTIEGGNVNGLMMFMIAWRQGKFVDTDACDFIASCLADRTSLTTGSQLTFEIPPADVIGEATKIGLLGKKDGEPEFLNADFAYFETEPSPGKRVKLGIVAAGIRPNAPHAGPVTSAIGSLIYNALTFPP